MLISPIRCLMFNNYRPQIRRQTFTGDTFERQYDDKNSAKAKIQAKLKKRGIDVKLNKNNIQVADMILSDKKLCNNENLMQDIEFIIDNTRTPESAKAKAEIMDLYCSNEKLYNNENIMQNIGNIILDAYTPESAEIAKTILSNEKLYNNENIMKNIGNIILFTDTPESVKARAEIMNLYCSNEKLYNNENVMQKIGDIISSAKKPEQIEIAKTILSNEKFYNNKNIMKYIKDFIEYSDTPESLEVAKTILSNEKLYYNENIIKISRAILFCTDTSESAKAKIEIMNLYTSNEKLYNNENVMQNIGNLIASTGRSELAKARTKIINLYCSDEKLYNNENLMQNIGNVLWAIEIDNLPLAKQIFETEGLNPENALGILKSVKLTDGVNAGKTDTQRVKQYTSLLQDKKLSQFVVEHLNDGMDMNTAAFLAKTQKKINAENTPKENKPQLDEELQNSHNVFTSHGMGDKEATAIVKAISQDGVSDIALQSVALDLLNKGIAANKIGDVIKNAKITGEFNQKIVDDFVALQNLGLNSLLEKNLATLNNISGADTAVKFNSGVKKQIKAMLERLTPEQGQALLDRGFDVGEINKKLDRKIAPNDNKPKEKFHIQSGLRSKQSLTGFEKVVVNKYNPDQKIWQNEQATRTWAEDKYNSIINRDYKSTTYEDANEPRERGLKEWADFMAKEPELKDNPFAKVILADFITKDLLPENADIPPQLDKALVKEILSSADKNTNFSKLYSDRLREKAMKNTMAEQVEVNGVKGTWYTVPQTDKSSADYKANVDKVKAFSDGTNWCIRTYNAEPYVEEGAMHFFVDENGLTQVCIRETSKNSVYEIQKRQQNATVPIAHIDVIDDYMTRNGLTPQRGCQARIETAREAKPEFDKLKAEFTKLAENKDYKSILEKIGITVKENPNGTIVLSHYDPELEGFTLSDLGIRENDLLNNVVKIEGDAKFKNSNATAAPMLKEVGGEFEFEDSSLSDVRSLKSINGKKIKWQT